MAAVPIAEVPAKQRERYESLSKTFHSIYAKKPDFFARAPGRVNLIGEHIDYCGYAVLPMAIEQDIVIAAAQSDDDEIQLNNSDSKYAPFHCKTTKYAIDRDAPKWFHYFLCGFRGICENFQLQQPRGMQLLIDGCIPASSGLSSSSALVCCAALATMRINDLHLSKVELSELCQHCERHIGTEGGGMDQAISFLAEAGTAKLIEFNPLTTTDVTLPHGAAFVIANSCVEMNKGATDHFNIRVAECRLATQVLAKSLSLPTDQVKKLSDVQLKSGRRLSEMISFVEEVLHVAPYTRQEIADLLGLTEDELRDRFLTARSQMVDLFNLRQRSLHVFSEADRVLKFKDMCSKSPADALLQLGNLMNDSHHSCSKLYDCSCQQLDELCALAVESGALGSRLTGAGWGGCTVSLIPEDKTEIFCEKIRSFYEERPERMARIDASLFASCPGKGAAFYSL
ncbi:hypothetical protein CAPTEDRAFT_220087 [Capitella teleta]|uniref:Galactokinase n=1 Tax=Capitella teleta TaxID=283909 RepID=R7UQ74_CAPTE|nr:hypothetical protein CAPTEDRAFT_220087 [Capitella teleta]|eukprot:ELU08263.1 hypothetical protein CAPTEDRAFT_220087 [Capitella teleta]